MSAVALVLFCLSTQAAHSESAAERVLLSDGGVVLGQVVEPSPRGLVRVVARREWVAAQLPDRLVSWEIAESKRREVASGQRRERLANWAAELRRGIEPDGRDVLLTWIDGQLRALNNPSDPPPALILIDLDARSVRKVERRPEGARRLLRQAWIAEVVEEPESLAIVDLERIVEGRGFAPTAVDPAPIDNLVGLLPESDSYWQARRAATEVLHDSRLRFVRYMGLVLPEDRQQLDPNAVGALAKSLLRDALGDSTVSPSDPLIEAQRGLERRGSSGMVVTELEIATDLSGVHVVTTLWARTATNHWNPILRRPVQVRAAEVGQDEFAALDTAPEVGRVFEVLRALGLGQLGDEGQRIGIQIGAATRRALGIAQSALQRELDSLTLPIQR